MFLDSNMSCVFSESDVFGRGFTKQFFTRYIPCRYPVVKHGLLGISPIFPGLLGAMDSQRTEVRAAHLLFVATQRVEQCIAPLLRDVGALTMCPGHKKEALNWPCCHQPLVINGY